jgi:hypothetical protein
VIQHIKAKCVKYVQPKGSPPNAQCTEKADCITGDSEWYEAWVIKNGKCYIPFLLPNGRIQLDECLKPHDEFEVWDEGPCSKGRNEIIGRVNFFRTTLRRPPWKLKGEPGHNDGAGSLPTTDPANGPPPGYSEVGARRHELTVDWFCCPPQQPSTWSHIPER